MRRKFRSEERHILHQSDRPEISEGANQRWVRRLAVTFPAFSNRNYRLYFTGQLVSLIGTWLQIVAQAWLVLQLTDSPVLLGAITALTTLPTLLFTLFGGVIVDRNPKKKVLLFTQVSSMCLAMILGALTLLDVVNLWYIGILSFLLGTVNSVDAPARQAFVSEITTKEQLPSAIAMNSAIFNTARAIGPAIAGVLIATVGTGWAFIVNGFTYLAVIGSLLSMQVEQFVAARKTHPIAAIKEGVRYSAQHPIIKNLLIFAAMLSIFGWSYTTILPLIAKLEFGLDATGLGYFYMAGGFGALLSAFLVAGLSKKVSPVFFIIGGNVVVTFNLVLFTLTTNFYLASVFLFFAGMGLVAQSSTLNSTLQGLVKKEFRGRIMSLYVLMFIGLVPLGNFQIGYISEAVGTGFAIQIGAGILFVFGMVLMVYRRRIKMAYLKYKRREDREIRKQREMLEVQKQ